MRTGIEAISDFIFMEDDLEKVKAILIPGASQPELIYKAAELFHNGYGEYIIVSGSTNKKLLDAATEAEFLAKVGIDLGIPADRIIQESQAKNTFENAKYSLKLLESYNLDLEKVILVCKAYHSRRAYLTYKTIFPKITKFIIQPIIDEREISKENWFLDSKKIKYVMGEVSKIGEYFSEYVGF